MRKILMLVLAVFTIWTQLAAQTRTITGRVTDATGAGVPNATVTVRGASGGTTTDANGRYSITVPANGRALVISSVNYASQELNIGNQSEINVSLTAAANSLDEVVVVGYGTQRRRDVTASISRLDTNATRNRPLQGPDEALRGQLPGVNVTQSSGTPGGSLNVNIRGNASISASNQPLYVIDGIPINIGSYAQLGAGGQTLNSLADINPNEIESFEVLKDAAATAVYGSRAANGVVLITTKRGRNQRTAVSISSYAGTQNVWRQLEPLTGPEHVALIQEAVRNRFTATTLPSALNLVGLDGSAAAFPTTNWQNEIFRSAPIQGHDVSLRGGNDRTRFFASASLFDQKGVILGSDFKRYNVRLNLDNTISRKFKVGTSIGLSRSLSNRIQNDNNIYGVLSTAVLLGGHIPVRNADGTFGRDPNASIENPVANATLPTFDVRNNRILANATIDYQIIPALSFRSVLGVDYISFRETQYIPSTHIAGAGVRGDGREGFQDEVNLTNENILTYSKSFGDHNLNATAVASFQESQSESVFAQATNFPGNDIIRLSAGSVRVAATSAGTSYGIIGYLGRLNYNYKGRYLVSGSVRRDGVSRFGRDKRWGTFPAASAAWRISDENFFPIKNVINELKFRGSWGVAGNSAFSDFGSLPLLSGGANYLQTAGFAPTQLGNPNLGWEETRQTNFGVDLSLWKSRVNLTADYFVRRTNNLLLGRPLPASSGFTTVNQNIGSTENKGLEFLLTTDILRGRAFTWTSNFNITFPENRVIKLAGAPFAAGFASWVEEGQPVGAFRGFRVAGIFQTQAEIAAAPTQSTLTRPGDIRFVDLNKDNVINTADQEIIGNAVPDFFGGFTNTFGYKGFELMVFFQYVQGNQIYNNTRAFAEGMNSVFGSFATVRNRWTPTNTNTDIPRAVFGDPNNNRRTSDRWLEDGSFVRLKNLILSYQVPTNITQRLKIQNLRVFVQGTNLVTWTKYSGFDPEVSTFSITNTAPGTDFLTFPQARNITGGINLTF